MRQTERTAKLTRMALMAAFATALLIVRIPFPPAPFLEYDPADIPILITGFAFGPLSGVVITVIVSFIQAVFLGGNAVYGFIMHVIATSTLVITTGTIYKFNKTKKGAVIALIAGVFAMTGIMIFANLLITPFFLGVPREAVAAMLIPAIIPFNLMKAGINAFITFLLYKPLSGFLHRR